MNAEMPFAGLLPLVCVLAALPSSGQQPPGRTVEPYTRAPDFADIRYGPHERNLLDLWIAKSSRPTPLVIYYHPGGFSLGDKSWIERYDKPLQEICLERGISVASANYRYSTQAIYPAPFEDCTRALQFVRLHAKEWNIDPKAVATAGASAGAMALWIAFHDEMADAKSCDPVKRQSTRVSVAGVVDGQTSYDPRVIAKLIEDQKIANVGALRILFGVEKGVDSTKAESAFPLYEDASPVHHLSAGDPPVFLYYTHAMRPLPPADQNEGIHNPRFGFYLKERMDKLGIECVVKLATDYTGDRRVGMSRDMVDFFQKHFPR